MTKETEDALLLRLEVARVGACECGTKSPDIQHHSLNCRYRLLAEAIERIEDLEKTFELRWLADTRAIVRWRAAAPGRNLTSPDHADLVVWLLEQIESLDRINTNLRAVLANEWTLSEEDSRKFVDAILNAAGPNAALKAAAKQYTERKGGQPHG